MVFKSLSKDFASFKVATYNIGNKNLKFTKLMNELQSYELMLNGSQQARKEETNLAVASSSKGKGKHAKRNKAKSSGPPKMGRKRTKKPKDLSKSKCFSATTKGTSRTITKSGRAASH